MIEEPMIGFGIVFGIVFMMIAVASMLIFIFKSKLSKTQETLCLLIFLGFFATGIILTNTDNTYKEYGDSVFEEIETLQCDQMQEHYDFYDSEDFKEKIKSKYLFECVSEKADLEWLK